MPRKRGTASRLRNPVRAISVSAYGSASQSCAGMPKAGCVIASAAAPAAQPANNHFRAKRTARARAGAPSQKWKAA